MTQQQRDDLARDMLEIRAEAEALNRAATAVSAATCDGCDPYNELMNLQSTIRRVIRVTSRYL